MPLKRSTANLFANFSRVDVRNDSHANYPKHHQHFICIIRKKSPVLTNTRLEKVNRNLILPYWMYSNHNMTNHWPHTSSLIILSSSLFICFSRVPHSPNPHFKNLLCFNKKRQNSLFKMDQLDVCVISGRRQECL